MLRALYRSYDGLLVSDPENAEWFAGPAMGIPRRKIFDAAYWSDGSFRVMMDTGPEESDSGVRPGHGRQHESAPAGGSLLEELLEIVSQG
jgi:hypothetical protein